jgi:hypothetical protein
MDINSKLSKAIETCSPELLLEALLFSAVKSEDDRNNVKLLGKIKDLVSKGAPAVHAKLAEIERMDNQFIQKAAGAVLIEAAGQSFIEPRGKFNCSISTLGIHMNGQQFSCFIPIDLISHMALVPSNATTKKDGEDHLMIRLSNPVKCNGKYLRSGLWVL